MISIILPTFNEKENITKLIEEIATVLADNSLSANIIVVDDNSPDGTAGEVEKIKNIVNYRIFLIRRKNKLGLGSAYIAGFKKALDLGADYIFEMDADLSHNPEDLPRFIKASCDHDLVLGSRYIKGGGIDNWSLMRKSISRGGTIYAKNILNLPFHDLTSGYKCFKRSVLENINIDEIASDGYSFQIEMTYRAFKKGFQIKEIPIMFRDRNKGKSKFSKKILWEAVWLVWKLRFSKFT